MRVGRKVHFAGNNDSETLVERIIQEGIAFTPMKSMHPSPDDLAVFTSLLNAEGVLPGDWVVLDGYHFNLEYQSSLREAGYKVLLFDDNAHQPEYSVDILLNQNVTASSYNYAVNSDAKMLLGPQYVLLREDFLDKGAAAREIGEVKTILVSIGGSDPKDVTRTVAEALLQLQPGDWKAVFVLGPSYTYTSRLKACLEKMPYENTVLSSVRDMAELISSADLSVSASGTTSWELSYLGVPAIYCAWADNQIEIGRWLAKEGAAKNLGWSDDLTEDDFASCLQELIEGRGMRQRLSDVSRAIVDGKGVDRVVAAMKRSNPIVK